MVLLVLLLLQYGRRTTALVEAHVVDIRLGILELLAHRHEVQRVRVREGFEREHVVICGQSRVAAARHMAAAAAAARGERRVEMVEVLVVVVVLAVMRVV